MKKRSKFTIQPRYMIFSLTILCIACMILSFINPDFAKPVKSATAAIIVPLETGINQIGKGITDKADNFQKVKDLRKENAELSAKIDELKEENSLLAQNKYELDRLRELYNLDQEYTQYPKVAARIIGKDTGNWFHIFTINKGSNDGIKKDMNVIAGGGLVGIITDVGKNYAKVRAIIDDESSVSVSFANTSDTGIVSGSLKQIESGSINIIGIQTEAVVTEGDMVVTSQLSNKFLPGLLVGYVNEVKLDSNKLAQSGTIRPAVDFKHLDEVLVILQLKEQPED